MNNYNDCLEFASFNDKGVGDHILTYEFNKDRKILEVYVREGFYGRKNSNRIFSLELDARIVKLLGEKLVHWSTDSKMDDIVEEKYLPSIERFKNFWSEYSANVCRQIELAETVSELEKIQKEHKNFMRECNKILWSSKK